MARKNKRKNKGLFKNVKSFFNFKKPKVAKGTVLTVEQADKRYDNTKPFVVILLFFVITNMLWDGITLNRDGTYNPTYTNVFSTLEQQFVSYNDGYNQVIEEHTAKLNEYGERITLTETTITDHTSQLAVIDTVLNTVATQTDIDNLQVQQDLLQDNLTAKQLSIDGINADIVALETSLASAPSQTEIDTILADLTAKQLELDSLNLAENSLQDQITANAVILSTVATQTDIDNLTVIQTTLQDSLNAEITALDTLETEFNNYVTAQDGLNASLQAQIDTLSLEVSNLLGQTVDLTDYRTEEEILALIQTSSTVADFDTNVNFDTAANGTNWTIATQASYTNDYFNIMYYDSSYAKANYTYAELLRSYHNIFFKFKDFVNLLEDRISALGG